MRKITCPCEQVFNVDIPETVNLDSTPDLIARIQDGSFLSCVCPSCNSILHTDLKTRIEWPSKQITLILLPEIERFLFLSGGSQPEENTVTVIGYAELADRVSVLAANLDPLTIETIKYHLAVKAKETNPDAKLAIIFDRKNSSGDLEFHIHGLKDSEVAITTVPYRLYSSILDEATKNPEEEPYSLLRNGSYLSVQNILIEE